MSTIGPIIAASIAAGQARIVREFIRLGALTPDTALAPERMPSWLVRQSKAFQRAGVVCVTSDGRLYLDRPSLDALERRQRHRGLIVLGAVVAAALVVLGCVLLLV